jgi:hypothetical protein
VRRGNDPKVEQRRKAKQRWASEAAQLARPALTEKLRDRCDLHGYRLETHSNRRGDEWLVLHIPNGSQAVEFRVNPDDTRELRRITQAVSSGLRWLGQYAAFTETDQGYIEAAIGSVYPQDHGPSWLTELIYRIDPKLFPPTFPNTRKALDVQRRGSIQGRMIAKNDRAGIRVEVSPLSAMAEMLRVRMYPTEYTLGYLADSEKTATSRRRALCPLWNSRLPSP